MKKVFALVLTLILLLTVGCGSQASQDIGESAAAAENVKVESDQGNRPRKGPLKDLMDALFPEQEIWMGMPTAEYSGEVGEVQAFYNGELYRYLYLEEDCMAAGTELYFLENGGLSMVYAYGTQLTLETLSEICGDPMFFREVDWESVSYWIVEDNLLIYYSADARLELYTEGWAGQFCPEQWLTAKSGLILVSAGTEGLYWYQDILNWKYGLYEESTDSTLTEPLYDACGDFDPEGMARWARLLSSEMVIGVISTLRERRSSVIILKAQSLLSEIALWLKLINGAPSIEKAIMWCSRNITALRSRMGF